MKKLLAALSGLIAAVAIAQSVPNGGVITQGQVWSAPQWNAAWQSKADINSPAFTGTPLVNGSPLTNSGSKTIITNPLTFGFGANAVAGSFVANSTHPPGVMGTFGTPSAQALYPTRDSVTMYMDNTAPVPIANQAGVFTPTTFTPTVPFTGAQLAQFLVGMNVVTNDATFYSGIVTSWAANGSSLTVSGWFQQGNTTGGQTPAGTSAIVNAVTKTWVQNGNCLYPASGSVATACAGYEMGLQDLSATATTNTNWMYDAVNLTSTVSPNNVAYIARGAWGNGFDCAINSDQVCFWVNAPGGIGLLSYQTTGNVIQATGILTSGFYFQSAQFNVAFNGQTDIGSKTATSSAPLVFHHSGHAGGDAFIQVTGGSGVSDGILTLTASGTQISGAFAVSGALNSNGTTFTLGAGTGACATSSTLVGGAIAGSFKCTGTAGAATQIINLPVTTNGSHCSASDATSGVAWANEIGSATTGKIAGTVATSGDVITFSCMGY